jgi:hypothetical protein
VASSSPRLAGRIFDPGLDREVVDVVGGLPDVVDVFA